MQFFTRSPPKKASRKSDRIKRQLRKLGNHEGLRYFEMLQSGKTLDTPTVQWYKHTIRLLEGKPGTVAYPLFQAVKPSADPTTNMTNAVEYAAANKGDCVRRCCKGKSLLARFNALLGF
jgi:hypothetical protein